MPMFERQNVTRWEDGSRETVEDEVVVESSLELLVNGREVVTLLSSPGDRKALAVGFMKSEGLIDGYDQLEDIEFLDSEKRIELTLAGSADVEGYFERKRALTSSCGLATSVIDDLDRIELTGTGPKIDEASQLSQFMRELQKRAELFRKTGGSHTAALASGKKLIALAEDIGRHNAVDKAIGKAFRNGIDLSDKILLTSGRLSSEMTLKAIRSRIPVLVSRSAPTTLAIRIARMASLTMVGFTRGKRMTFYSGEGRLFDESPVDTKESSD